MTTGEVARRCQVSVGTVKNWIEAGQLEAFRTPRGHFRIRASALRRFHLGVAEDQVVGTPLEHLEGHREMYLNLIVEVVLDLAEELPVVWATASASSPKSSDGSRGCVVGSSS